MTRKAFVVTFNPNTSDSYKVQRVEALDKLCLNPPQMEIEQEQ